MVSWLHSWWQDTSKKRKIAQIIVLVIVVGLIVSFIGGYFFNWTWTGFGPYTPPTSGLQRGKTLYDWLQLAIIPAAIAFGVLWFNRVQQKRDQQLANQRSESERKAAEQQAELERELTRDNQREVLLQAYLDKMSELLLEKKLREPGEDDEVRTIARVRTLTILPRLDPNRKCILLQFLHGFELIHKDNPIIDLHEADFRGIVLGVVDLTRANLSGANLSGADLHGAHLSGVNLSNANLSGADLSGANLKDATGITTEQLNQVRSLKDAIMPDGTKHA